MARISRVRGPASSFSLTAAFQIIPGMVVARHFGNGTLLVLGQMTCLETGAAAAILLHQIRFDGVVSPFDAWRTTFAASQHLTVPFQLLFPVSPGVHTIELGAQLSIFQAVDVLLDRCELMVIELPEWDLDENLITL